METILKQFAVYTNQPLSNMTVLLKLLKKYRPDPHYDLLPCTGRKLLDIDGQDIGDSNAKLPEPDVIDNGKYFHFGVEKALIGKSPGVYHKYAHLGHFVELCKTRKELVPLPLIKQVISFVYCLDSRV
jgi:hypothetical protein